MEAPLLYERICHYLLDEVRSGALSPGARVPSEMELAVRFEVSRITSKRALEVLRQAGVIERIRGKGSFVARDLPDLDQIAATGRLRDRPAERAPVAIGLVMPDLSEVYGLELFYAIEEYCAQQNINLVIRRSAGHQAEEEKAIESLVGSGLVEGLVVFPVHGEYYNATLLRMILDGQPLVLVDRFLSGIAGCAVHTDNLAAAKALTERLIDLGHRHIAFISPPPHNTSSIEARLEGFRAAFSGRGLANAGGSAGQHVLADLCSTLPGAFHSDSIAADVLRIKDFLRERPEVTAFVASEYNLARVLARAQDTPRLIACFDSPGDPVAGPQFLHVRQDQREMGRKAVELLLAQIRGEDVPRQTTIPFTIVEPDSPS